MTKIIRALIWDMGGVLLRTEDKTSRKKMAKKFGLEIFDLENAVFESETARMASIGKISAVQHWEAVAKYFGLNDVELADFKKDFWAGDLMDYELLEFIGSTRPALKTALLSNAWSDARCEIGEPTGLLSYFDVSIFSAEVFLAKPDPQIYLLVLEKLGVLPEEAVFIDDMERNVQAANNLGIYGLRFFSHQQIIDDLQKII